ncbi:MAG TPA: AAA family ATPase [Candidatus Babeliales bacterium]|nr:AAA family ATPase [Candidatus Babeliales bacterium]
MYRLILFSLLIISSTYTFDTKFNGTAKTLPGRIGLLPEELDEVLHDIQALNAKKKQTEDNPELAPQKFLFNRHLIHGEKGNGKSTTIRAIALKAQVPVFMMLGNEACKPGADPVEIVRNHVALSAEVAEDCNTTAVVLFEEVEGLPEVGRSTLNVVMDQYRNDPRVWIILTTNHLKQLRSDLISRCPRVSKMYNPKSEKRYELLDGFCKNNSMELTDVQLKYLTKNTHGCCIRNIEDIVDGLKYKYGADLTKVSEKELVEVVSEVKKGDIDLANAQYDRGEKFLKKVKQAGIVAGSGTAVAALMAVAAEKGPIVAKNSMSGIKVGGKWVAQQAYRVWQIKNG